MDAPASRSFIERITRCTDPELDGAFILMHVGEPSTASALPQILQVLQRPGFQLVTISGLVRADLPKTR